ncbi:hypothetical protein KJ652_06410 [Patescibacteria group bacterium]|nr:hypothetical protein [Patescibacteria group bacterium]
MKLQELQWQNPQAKEQIEWGGSKAGSYEFARQHCPDLSKYLPDHFFCLEPGFDVNVCTNMMNLDNPKIVRGCDRRDFAGMVDVLKSIPNVTGKDAVRAAIHEVLAHAKDPGVKSYVEWETGKPFDGNIMVQIEDYHGQERGSIIEHPHERGVYRIGNVIGNPVAYYDEDICDETGRGLLTSSMEQPDFEHVHKDPLVKESPEIIDLYQCVRESGLIPNDYSFQMEYVIEDFSRRIRFTQARLFKQFDPADNFKIDVPSTHMRTLVRLYECFGKTPKEGVELPLATLYTRSIHAHKDDQGVAYVYGQEEVHESAPLHIQPDNMAAYLPAAGRGALLEHGHYRWMQKASLTLCSSCNLDFMMPNMADKIKNVRLYANGLIGAIAWERTD